MAVDCLAEEFVILKAEMEMTYAGYRQLVLSWRQRSLFCDQVAKTGHRVYAELMQAVWDGYARQARAAFDREVGDKMLRYWEPSL